MLPRELCERPRSTEEAESDMGGVGTKKVGGCEMREGLDMEFCCRSLRGRESRRCLEGV